MTTLKWSSWMEANWKHFLYNLEQDKGVHYDHSYSIWFLKLDTTVREKKEIKRIYMEKEDVKLSIWGWCDPIFQNSIRRILELTNEFSEVAGYKSNVQKSIAFLYSNSESAGKEIRKKILFTITSRKKYLGINLTKDLNDPCKLKLEYPEEKKIEKDLRSWKDLPYSWIVIINFVKMSLLCKHYTDSLKSSSKYQMTFFMELEIQF